MTSRTHSIRDDASAASAAVAGPVVVGFDGSAESRDALALGRDLARLTDAPIVVGVVEPLRSEPYPFPDPLLLEELPARGPRDDTVLEDAAEVLGDDELAWGACFLVARSAAEGLQHIAEQEQAGVVVLGRTHRRGVGAVVPGTTASRLLHGAPCSVAVASAGWAARERPIARVAAGFDGSREARIALAAGADLARRAGATLEAVSAFQPPSRNDPVLGMTSYGHSDAVAAARERVERELRAATRWAGVESTATRVAIEGRPPEVLEELSREVDVLAVGSRRYGPLRSVALGDVAARLARSADCALLVTPRPR